ncbi:HEPN domain protein [compost metagenome]
MKGVEPNTLIQILQQILEDTDIVKDERDVIRNRLVEGAEKIHSDNTPEQQALEEAVIKPVINFIMELQSANDNLIAAITLNKEMLSEPSINRSYYSMMHALKALLENKRKLSDWEPDKLNVSENHWRLEKKLEELCNENVISNGFYSDFKYVKQKRWIADYNVSKLNIAESEECILRATSFLEEVKNITKGNLVI